MARLSRPVDQHLDDPVNEEMMYRLWRGVGQARAAARGQKPSRWLMPALTGVGVGALALAALLFTLPPSRGPEPLSLATNEALPSTLSAGAEPEHLRLSDTSEIALAPDTELQLVTNHRGVFETRLLRGVVSMDVTPGGPRRYRVDCGLALVEVVGTRFEIERSEAAVAVRVSRGRVRVTDRVRSRVRELGPGDSWAILAAPSEAVAPAPSHPPAAPSPTPSSTREPSPPPSTGWRQLAAQGRWDEAWDEVGPARIAARARAADGDELLALADVARQSGHPEAAVRPLETLLSRYPNDARAGLAAYTLGILRMDRLDQPAEAAEAFERALSAGLPEHLVEHAMGRLAVAHHRAGEDDAAHTAARRYLARFPDGPMAQDVRAYARGGDEFDP